LAARPALRIPFALLTGTITVIRVIDRDLQVSARRDQHQHRQLRDGQAELVQVPAGPGEEVMRPVMPPRPAASRRRAASR
jgi:hypothetical protein